MATKPYFPTTRDLPDSAIRRILDSLLNLIFPELCFLCSAPLARQRDCGVCTSCWNKAAALKIKPPRCPSCGLPLHSVEENSNYLCGRCILQMPAYAGARSFGYYTAELSSLIQGMKFSGRRNLAGLLAPLLADTFYDTWGREEFDILAPVPLHPARRRDRGYNQSELLACSLARQISLPFKKDALIRTRPTLPQVGLTDTQRLDNVRGAFKCADPRKVSNKRVLLIDDVMTTGATAASAAQALIEGGALRVSVLTVARTVR